MIGSHMVVPRCHLSMANVNRCGVTSCEPVINTTHYPHPAIDLCTHRYILIVYETTNTNLYQV